MRLMRLHPCHQVDRVAVHVLMCNKLHVSMCAKKMPLKSLIDTPDLRWRQQQPPGPRMGLGGWVDLH